MLTTGVTKKDNLRFVISGKPDGDTCTVNGITVLENFWVVLTKLVEA